MAELKRQLRQKQEQAVYTYDDLALNIDRATFAMGSPGPSFFDDVTLSTLFVIPSVPPLAVSRHCSQYADMGPNQQGKQRFKAQDMLRSLPPALDLGKVPQAAVAAMLRIYAVSLMHHYPIVERGMLQRIYQSLYQKDQVPGRSNFDNFVLYIVLAISSVSMAWKANKQARALSLSFFSSALQYLHRISQIDGLLRLQVILLLAHYAHLNPEVVNAWTCTAVAVRACLDLGLPCTDPPTLSEADRQLRRKLFWVAYDLDRSSCAMLRLPLSFPEESISISNFQNSGTKSQGRLTTDHIYVYRKLEIEVHRVLHLLEETPMLRAAGLSRWLPDIQSSLEEWYALSHETTPKGSLTFRHVMYYYLKAKIYRPTPRRPNQSPEDQQTCFNLCQKIIESIRDLAKTNTLIYTWQAVHILFGAAIILLNICWECRTWASMNASATHVLTNVLPCCLDILETIGVTWQNSRVCANHIRPIIDDVSRAYGLNIAYESNTAVDDIVTTETLKTLLFADRPPRNEEDEASPSHRPVTPTMAPLTELDGELLDFLPFDLPFDLPIDWDLNNTEFLWDI